MDARATLMVDSLTVYLRGRAQFDNYRRIAGGFSKEGKYTEAIRRATELLSKSRATLDEDPATIDIVSSVISSNVQRLYNLISQDFSASRVEYLNQRVEKIWNSGDLDKRNKREARAKCWSIFLDQVEDGLSGHEAYLVCVGLAKKICPPVLSGMSREIFFTPENQQAGIGILSYFSVVLNQKLPSADASVSIRQERDRVILKIEYPDGSGEELSQLLTDYGMVVVGKKSLEEFLPDPIQAMALKHKLEQVQMELRHTKDILALERSSSSMRTSTLEEDVKFLKSQLALQLQSNAQLTSSLISKLGTENSSSLDPAVIEILAILIQSVVTQDKERVVKTVIDLGEKSPSVLERLNIFVTSSAISGIIGNAAYSWLLPVWPVAMAAFKGA